MKRPSFTKRIIIGIGKHPWRFVISVFIVYSVIWTILEPMLAFIPISQTNGVAKYISLISTSIIIAAITQIPPIDITIKLPGTNTTNVRISFDSFLVVKGDKALAVNEFFDSDLTIIRRESLHGILISQICSGPEDFERIVDDALESESFEVIDRKNFKNEKVSRNKKFSIGTTAVINKQDDKYFLFALSREQPDKSWKADLSDLFVALNGLWKEVRIKSSGNTLIVPLIGSGHSALA